MRGERNFDGWPGYDAERAEGSAERSNEREPDVDLRREHEVFADHERIDNGRDIDTQLAKLRDSLSEDSDGIIHIPIEAYEYDMMTNPFVGTGFAHTKTYEISHYIDIVFLHRFMHQDIIVCGLQSRMFVDERGRASFVKHIRETGGVPLRTDNPAPYDIIGQLFSPFLQYHSTDAVFRLYHTMMPRVERRPQYPIDVWLIFDAHAYEPCDGSEDFRQAFRLRDGYDRRASLLGIAQIN